MLNYLPDELVVHMCRYMDSYSLLKFGRWGENINCPCCENLARSSSRLYNVVCTPEVWRRLLRGIEDFTEAKVDNHIFLHWTPQ